MPSTLKWYGDEKKEAQKNGAIRALVKSTNLVQSSAKLLVRVDTGNLRSSIIKATAGKQE